GRQSREAAEQAVAYARRRLAAEARPEGQDEARLVYERADVRLLAPLPRPRSLRDFSVFEEHMSLAPSIPPKQPKWYQYPPYYKGNPAAVIGPEDPIPYPYY